MEPYFFIQGSEGTLINFTEKIIGSDTGSPKKHKNRQTTWGFLTGCSERIEGPSLKT